MLKQGFFGVALGGALIVATSAGAAPMGLALKPTAAVAATRSMEEVYYYRGGNYPYRWHGGYYRHRRWSGGRWSYW
jgi:hypothetical protein